MMMRIGRHARQRVTACGVAIAVLAVAHDLPVRAGDPTEHASTPGMTYDSLARLPDFSGWWYPSYFDELGGHPLGPSGAYALVILQNAALKPLLTAQAAAALEPYEKYLQSAAANLRTPPDPLAFGLKPADYCAPPGFAGDNGGFHEDIEILFTPGRVTITNEGGLIRRIYLDRELPADVDETSTGTSVGHWEDGTLSIETVGLDRDNQFGGFVSPLKLGRDARIVERFALGGPDTLKIETRITAPDLVTKPLESIAYYRRDRQHVFREASQCARHDRSMDVATGEQRFDLTPPPDLPPPPR